jgi:putative endonuclease
MSTTEIGQAAEAAAAKYLEDQGYRILGANVRTRWSELDLVAERGGELTFVEVKYRQRTDYGDGLAAITPDKARRLRQAAAAWAAAHRYEGAYTIGVVALTGAPGHWQINWLPDAIGWDG